MGIVARLKEPARQAAKVGFAAADLFTGRLRGPRILVYHQIGAGLGRQMEVTEEAFTAHLDWIQANGSVVSLEDALAAPSAPGADRRHVLTFDDGYDDFHRHGYPELKRRGMPFTLYLTTHPTDSGEALTPGGRAEPLTWGQVEEMAAGGLMTLGAHTHRHPDLRHLAPDQVEEDLGTSDALIEQRLGIAPRHFTYPWGYWSPTADPVVRRRYASATVGSGPALISPLDLHTVTRIPVQLSDRTWLFTRKMYGGFRLEDKVRRRVTGYRGP